jgi:hypothetical protein
MDKLRLTNQQAYTIARAPDPDKGPVFRSSEKRADPMLYRMGLLDKPKGQAKLTPLGEQVKEALHLHPMMREFKILVPSD